MSEIPAAPNSTSQETPAPAAAVVETPAPATTEGAAPSLVTEPPKVEEPAAEYVPLTAEDITFPEGFEVDTEIRDEALAVFNDRELSPKEQMQKLVDLQLRSAQAASEASSKVWTETQEQWQTEVKADPDVGGDKLQPTLARVTRLVSEYGTPELNDVFDLTGAGNNVHVIKFLNNIASKLTEGGAVSGAPTAGGEVSAASRMFPSMKG